MGCCGKKIKNIITGWYNLAIGFTNEDIQKRISICRNCGDNRWKGLRMWCNQCHCYIPAKVRVKKEKCKLDKW